MTWFNELNIWMQVYLSGVIFVMIMLTVIFIYGYSKKRMRYPVHQNIIGLISLSLISWGGLILLIIVYTIGINKQVKSKNKGNKNE